MFLVVFVTLVISIIALFGQVLTLQTAKINAAQIGLMQTMMAWHAGAVAVGKTILPASLTTAGCYLNAGLTGVTNCPSSVAIANVPPGYNFGQFSFNSLAFVTPPPAVAYVVTYVGATAATGNLVLPGNGAGAFETGYSMKDLSRQFARAVPVYLAYGSVTSSGILTIVAKSGGSATGDTPPATTYSIPISIPTGSLAILSVAQ